jgi:hypothetical protein
MSIGSTLPYTIIKSKVKFTVHGNTLLFNMESMNTNKILWENLLSLMIDRYGCENLYKVNKDSKNLNISLGSLTRIKAQETSVGLEVIDKLSVFFGVTPSMLLSEGLKDLNTHPFDSFKKDFDESTDETKRVILLTLSVLKENNKPAKAADPVLKIA